MINTNAKLNKEVLNAQVEKEAIRTGFGEGLLEAGKKNDQIVALCADLTDSTRMSLFKEEFPSRFIQVGVAEQNLAGVASGMAAMGKVPFISSYAMFSPGRNWEQIRTTICYNDVPVKIAGSHAGVSVGPDGGTHQAIEDIAIARVIPNMTVISPCDAIEARKATVVAAETEGPVYLRLAREKTALITTEETPFEIGKAQIFFEADTPEVGIIATGSLVHQALLVANSLDFPVTVMNLPTIKPLDESMVLALARKTNAIVTVEEHQKAGGMGSSISEFLSQNYPVPIEFVGVNDQFGQSGKPEELIKHYEMDEDGIKKAVEKVLKRKNSKSI